MEEPLLPDSNDVNITDHVSVGESSMTDWYRTDMEDGTGTDIVDLIDISYDKRWICYIHYSQDDQGNTNVKITQKRLKAFNVLENREEVIVYNQYEDAWEVVMDLASELSEVDDMFDLNKHYSSIQYHSRFLSISPCGNYIALSCYKEDGKEKMNSSCIIFKVKYDSIAYYTSLNNCNGCAVFLNKKNDELCLAIINTKKLVIYNNFTQSNTSPSYFYNLTPFTLSLKDSKYNKDYQDFFFRRISWARIIDKGEAKKVLNLSRHIRDDVLVTPFADEGIVRIWSIKDDGVRLTSFSAPNEHVVALSKDLKYAATIRDSVRTVKIYNIKNGSLVYNLKPLPLSGLIPQVTHVRFCYGSRYLAMSALQRKIFGGFSAIFEVWYVEAEKSIYRVIVDAGVASYFNTVKPFVFEDLKKKKKRCLKGVFTYTNLQNENKIHCIELKIDEELESDSKVAVQWINYDDDGELIIPSNDDEYEIGNDITDHINLKCANISVENKKFYIRFGNRMIQLWRLGDPDASNDQDKENQLVYIRAHRCPNHRISYLFQDIWVIENFDSIKFTKDGRVTLNIKQNNEYWANEMKGLYHTDEIFLPINNRHVSDNEFDYHMFESACQALYYLNWCWDQKNYKCKITNWDETKEHNEHIEFLNSMPDWNTWITNFSNYNLGWDKKMDDRRANQNRNMADYDRNWADYGREPNNFRKNFFNYTTNFDYHQRYKRNLHNLFEKTCKIINKALTRRSPYKSNYFATIAGSRTLTMLASFPQGREIIKLLLKSEDSFSFSIFSYRRHIPFYDNKNHEKEGTGSVIMKKISKRYSFDSSGMINYRNSPFDKESTRKLSSVTENENVLIVLVNVQNYDLYKLMFNRILYDSKEIGPGCLSALVDVLLFLQEKGKPDLLLSSCQKLSYLAIDTSMLGILPSETGEVIKVNEYDSKIRNLECHSTMEQLQKYNINMLKIYDCLYYKLHMDYAYKLCKNVSWSVVKTNWNKHIKNPFKRIFNTSSKNDSDDRTTLCVIPLPYFNTYSIPLEDRPKFEERIIYKETSVFVSIASNQNSSSIFRQGDTVLEVVLQYKWRNFLRARFIGVCFIHAIYYITYCTGVLFALELYGYKTEEDDRPISGGHLASIICMSISGSLLLIQEIRQITIVGRLKDYLNSGYNWVDIAAFIFPLVTLAQLLYNWNYFYETCSITTLILWIHAVIRLRVISFVGITLETIIQLSQKVWSILFIFLLVVFAFTHSFIVLLRQREDTYFQETYNGVTSMYSSDTPTNGQIPIAVGKTVLHDVSSDNGFSDPFKAFYQVWLVIFGVWDPLVNGEAGDDKMVFILCIMFALITVLIFTNMVIALMSSTIDEVRNKGDAVWVSHFASVMAEMEQLWCLPSTRRNRNNNPAYIYYKADNNVVEKHKEKLEDETNELRKKIFVIDS